MVRCPYNDVLSFIYRYKPNKANKDIKILELGSGDGNNLWFLAKENFDVYGVEINENSISNSKKRLEEDNLDAIIKQGSFTTLDFEDGYFDIVFDRGEVTCVSFEDASKVVSEVNRVLKKSGKFYFNPFSELDKDISRGTLLPNGMIGDFDETARLKNHAAMSFYSYKDILNLFKDKFNIVEASTIERTEIIKSRGYDCATWEIIGEKL